MVTYTYTVNQGLTLNWIVEPFLLSSTRIRFSNTDSTGNRFDCSGVSTVNCAVFDFVATLTGVNPDITSTLTFTATARLNGTVVQCTGTTANAVLMNSSTLNVAGAATLQLVLLYYLLLSN